MLSEKEFIEKDGLYCPYCQSENMDVLNTEFDIHISRDVMCLDCSKEWIELYSLTDLIIK